MGNFVVSNKITMATEFNDMQKVKRAFFTMRNGALADNMRRQGANYRIIFGVNLPQLVEIAREIPHDAILAQALWDNKTTRESLLLAPMIYPIEQFTIDTARKWVAETPSTEVADILCHRLLRYTEFADSLADENLSSDIDMQRYTALRLKFNRLPHNINQVLVQAQTELSRNRPLTIAICHSLIDEITFLLENRD